MTRFGILTFGAVILATAILAVLGYLSLRQWEASAELLLRERARDMATMAAEKVEMAIRKSEEESLTGLWDTHILRLRQKFEKDPERPLHILTAHGQGYRFAE